MINMFDRRVQSAFERHLAGAAVASIDDRVATAMFTFLIEDLGLPESVARERAELELARRIPEDVCSELEASGIPLCGMRVLDLGAGLGGLSAEMAARGGQVVAIEPGAGWRALAADRLSGSGNVLLIGAVGEQLPIASNSIDLIVSLQVLEHVRNPQAVIQEAFRVLKPGGCFYAAYENYLSFWEPHYRVRWVPLLPKALGGVYLRLLGRSPKFLRESITYTTFPAVRRTFLGLGFQCMRKEGIARALKRSGGKALRWRILRGAAAVSFTGALTLAAAVDYVRRMFRTSVTEIMRKPVHPERPDSPEVKD